MDNAKEWVMLKDRPEWADVLPIPQDDGPYSVVSIAYSEKFRDVYDHLRGIIKLNEKSERALELTQYALQLNPSNYSVWQLRRDIIKHLNKNIKEELKYTESVMANAEKNYQVWHHRHVLVEWSNDPSDEKEVTDRFLRSDAKNYHAWQHRQWYIRKFNLFEGELEFVDELLNEDVRNNSAWNQRYFILNNTTEWTEEIIQQEVDYTLEKIDFVRLNESSWNYLRGVMFHASTDSSVHEKVWTFCDVLLTSGETSPYLLAYIIDMCVESLEKKMNFEGPTADKAIQLCELLETEFDPIRCQYWKYIKNYIKAKESASLQGVVNSPC